MDEVIATELKHILLELDIKRVNYHKLTKLLQKTIIEHIMCTYPQNNACQELALNLKQPTLVMIKKELLKNASTSITIN